MAAKKRRTYTDKELFRATCGAKLWERAPDDLTQKWRSHLAGPIPYGHADAVEAWRAERGLEAALKPWSVPNKAGELGRWALCPFTTEDREAFLDHMLTVHGAKLGQTREFRDDSKFIRLKSGGSGPLLGQGFRWRPVTGTEKPLLGRVVVIQRYADTAVTAQITSLAGGGLIGGRNPVFAYDETSQAWAFDSADKQPTAYRLDRAEAGFLTPTKAGVVEQAVT